MTGHTQTYLVGTHIEIEYMRRLNIYGESIYTEKGHTWNRDGIYTERKHTQREDRWKKDTRSGDIYREKTYEEATHIESEYISKRQT